MVRTKAPLLSLGASGQVGGVIIASNWKGRTYSKKLTIPKNPNTAPQAGVRACLQFLTQHWTTISAGDKATWNPIALTNFITSFNAYVQTNLLRWSTGGYPGDAYPVTAGGGAAQQQSEAALPYGRGIRVQWTMAPFLPDADAVIYRWPSTGFTAGYDNARKIALSNAGANYHWIDTPLASGTYYYRLITFTNTGKASTISAEFNATVP